MKLEGKVALITGGTSGIGRAAAVALAAEGARIVLTGRRQNEGNETVRQIVDGGGQAIFCQGDVTDESHLAAAVETALSGFGRLDIAVNNAGVEKTGALVETELEDFRRVFEINVWGVLASMKYECPAMLKTGGGSIINTSSVAGKIGMAGVSVYVASKHAVEGLTKCVALEYASQGIRVNAVAPAAIETEMMDRFAGPMGSDQRKYLEGLHPIGRMGKPKEIADAIVFLASDDSSFITGQSLVVDGGFTAQ